MIKRLDEFIADNYDDFMFEMANVVKKRSKLPMNIWISQSKEKHRPRIKIQNNYSENVEINNSFTITINDFKIVGNINKITSKDIEKLKEYIILNKEILLAYWNHEINDTYEILAKLKTFDD